ncbi:MAG: hypothetical protein ABL984_05855 [Pyrinomonadaceae bacterium]
MKRHFLGSAVFAVVLVGFGVSFELFDRLTKLSLVSDEAVTVEANDYQTVTRNSEELTVQLTSLTYDEVAGRFAGRVSMRWNRTSSPPGLVTLEIGITTSDKPGDRDVIKYERVMDGFTSGNVVTRDIEWVNPLWGRSQLQTGTNPPNFYAHVAVNSVDDSLGGTKLVIYEYNYLRGSVPLVIKHGRK